MARIGEVLCLNQGIGSRPYGSRTQSVCGHPFFVRFVRAKRPSRRRNVPHSVSERKYFETALQNVLSVLDGLAGWTGLHRRSRRQSDGRHVGVEFPPAS